MITFVYFYLFSLYKWVCDNKKSKTLKKIILNLDKNISFSWILLKIGMDVWANVSNIPSNFYENPLKSFIFI